MAKSKKDLKILSSIIQDSIIPIGDFGYFKQDKKVMFAINRFCWEKKNNMIRSNSVFIVHNVEKIQIQNINISNRKQSLYLLDVQYKDNYLVLVFSGSKKMRLGVSSLEVSLADTGETWKAHEVPQHK